MDKSDIKKAIRNMNVWLDECHNDGDTVVMTANVLRSIRDNYCELLRCRDAIERLADRNRRCIYLSDEETSEHCVDSICPQYKTEGQIKSEARKEFAWKIKKELSFVPHLSLTGDEVVCVSDIDILLEEMESE